MECKIPLDPPFTNILDSITFGYGKKKRGRLCRVCNHSIRKPSQRHKLRKEFVAQHKKEWTMRFCFKCCGIIGKQQVDVSASRYTNSVLPSSILKHWIHVCSGSKNRMVPYGIPILYCRKELYSDWLYSMLTTIYRTRTEWYSYINQMLVQRYVHDYEHPYTVSLKHPNPFFHTKYIANHVYNLFILNSCIRSNILKCVQRRLLAKMDARTVGEDDLYTTTAIPSRSLVAVYDYKTRAKYVFHTNTILKMIIASLKYSSYGIAKPTAPKNPYTNLDWTIPQLMSISQQITRNMTGINRMPPPLFLVYFNVNFELKKFGLVCEKDLGINAANELFKMKDDIDTREIYGETIDDMVHEMALTLGYSTRECIVERKLSVALQQKWDDMVLAIWIYSNINTLQKPYKCYDELTKAFTELFNDTRKYVYSVLYHRRKRTSLLHTQAMNELLDASIYPENTLEYADTPMNVIIS